MQKKIMIFVVLAITLACNMPIQSNEQGINATQQIETDVVSSLTAFVESQNTENPIDQKTSEPTAPTSNNQQATLTPPPPSATLTVPSPTLTPTATLAGGVTETLGDPDWRVSFTNGKDGFYDDDDDQCIINAQNGKLVLTSTMKTTGWHSWSMHYHEIGNFYLESTINTQVCNGSDEYGIIFRAPDYSNGYFFGLTCDGKYNLRTLTDDYHTIIDWTSSDEIHAGSGQSNLVGVMAEGNHISLYVNNEKLTEFDDMLFAGEGMFGVFIAAYQTPGFTIELDDIAYWILD